MSATFTPLSEVEVEKLAGQLEIEYCKSANYLRRRGTTLLEYVEVGLREVGALPPIPFAGMDQRESHLAAHYPVLAGVLAKMQMEMPACGC